MGLFETLRRRQALWANSVEISALKMGDVITGEPGRRYGVNVDKWDYSRRLDVKKCDAGKEPAAVKEPREPAFEEEDKKKNDQEIGSHRSGNTRDAELPGQAAGDLEVDAAGSEIFC